MMDEAQRLQAIQECILLQYESMGFAVLEVTCISPGVFRTSIIDEVGPREILVTVLLHMVPIYATAKRQ